MLPVNVVSEKKVPKTNENINVINNVSHESNAQI